MKSEELKVFGDSRQQIKKDYKSDNFLLDRFAPVLSHAIAENSRFLK